MYYAILWVFQHVYALKYKIYFFEKLKENVKKSSRVLGTDVLRP